MNLGINVVEVDGRATPSIHGASTSVAGFVIRAQRGVPGAVHQVTNFTQFTEHFGGYLADAYGAYSVRGFFDNGGAMAYVTRVVVTDSKVTGAAVVASATFPASGAAGGDPVALTVKAGYRGDEDPGAWGNELAVSIAADPLPSGQDKPSFTLTVHHKGRVVETWEKLTQASTAAKLNDELAGSKYITVTTAGTALPANTSKKLLAGGVDDTVPENNAAAAAAREAAYIAGIKNGAFDTFDVQLLCCPESATKPVVESGLTYCATRGDCIFVSHVPENQDASAAKSHGGGLRANNVYGALYFPFILVADPLGGQKWIPPTGHVLGVYARTERERGIWKAPAGNAARVNNALDVKHHITDTTHTDLVKAGSVNAVRFIPGQGIVVDSSRTLSTNPLWQYVNVRLLFNFVKTSLKGGLRWVVQEPNDPALWNKVKYNSVTPFLMGLWRLGAFGPGQPNEVFTVKVDAENNPPASIQQGILNVEVYFYPSRPAETIVITIGQQEGGAKASEG